MRYIFIIGLHTITEHLPCLAHTAVSYRHCTAAAEAQRLERCSCSMTRTRGVGLFRWAVGGQWAADGPPLRHALLALGLVHDSSF